MGGGGAGRRRCLYQRNEAYIENNLKTVCWDRCSGPTSPNLKYVCEMLFGIPSYEPTAGESQILRISSFPALSIILQHSDGEVSPATILF